MKRLLMILLLCLVPVMVVNCGSGGGGGAGTQTSISGKTSVTINLGQTKTASSRGKLLKTVSSIPSAIYSVKFTITAPDITPIIRIIFLGGSTSISETFEIPNGPNRHFVIEAMDESGNVLFAGDTFLNVFPNPDGSAITLEIAMVSVEAVSPGFSGLELINSITPTSFVLSWNPANDNVSTPDRIQYLIYVSTSPGGQDLSNPTFITDLGATSFVLTGLNPNTIYYVIVRAKDERGNIDGNTEELFAMTLKLPDSSPPDFGGIVEAVGFSEKDIAISWNGATDVETPTADIVYLVYMSTTSLGENLLIPSFTLTGLTSMNIGDLSSDTKYCFIVRAKDKAGNIDGNTVEKCTKTLAPPPPPPPPPPHPTFTPTPIPTFTPTPTPTPFPLSISPASATVAALTNPDGGGSVSCADDNQTYTISGGLPPYTVSSGNTSLIASPGLLAGNSFTIDPNSTCSPASVILTVTDSASQITTTSVSLVPPALPTFGCVISPCIPVDFCEDNPLCFAGTETRTLNMCGVSPFSLTSLSPSLVPSQGPVSSYSFLIDATDNSITADTFVDLELTDSCGGITFFSAPVIAQQPELFISNVVVSTTPTNSISFDVVNIGPEDAVNVQIPVVMFACFETCSLVTVTVPAGSSVPQTVNAIDIIFDYRVHADAPNSVIELDEANNFVCTGYLCNTHPPILCGSFSYSW